MRPRISSLCLFVALAALSIVFMQLASAVFPGDIGLALVARWVCMAGALALLTTGIRLLLSRDGIAEDSLGLSIDPPHGAAVLLGVVLGGALMLVLLAGFYCVSPFELARGPRPLTSVSLSALNYFLGNFGEELVFRGYLLVVLARWLGTVRAVLLLAIPFGLMHVPGLDSLAAAKMMLTTGTMHLVFAAVFLATGTLWAAVAMHATVNTLLHTVAGVDSPGVLSLLYKESPPASFDAPFLIFLGTSSLFAIVLASVPVTRRGARRLENG
jgi:membrane protease YdiL (CAAX protease family)